MMKTSSVLYKDTIRSDAMNYFNYFNVRSKADRSQINLPRGTKINRND